MPEIFKDLKQVHYDILKEIGNIGSGNAVTALSKIMKKKVDMDVPVVNIVDFKDISNFVGGAENIIIGILVNLSGDVNGIMMFIVNQRTARTLINNIFNKEMGDSYEFNEIELSALKEVGNILSSSYLGSLSMLINKKIVPSVPYLSIDMANAILSVPAIEFSKIADKVLFIESIFKSNTENVSGYFVLVPDMPSFDLILKSLGVD